MLEKTKSREFKKELMASSAGVDDKTYGPIIQYSPSWGKRGEKGTRLWTHGWHACAAFVWGESWALEQTQGLDACGRLSRAETMSPYGSHPHAHAGWVECAEYCRDRLSKGDLIETLTHDLQAIVDVHYASKQSRRPNLSGLMKRSQAKKK